MFLCRIFVAIIFKYEFSTRNSASRCFKIQNFNNIFFRTHIQTSRILAKHDISAALHCRSDGEKINSTSIREVMKTVVDSLPRGKILKTDYLCRKAC